MKQVKYLILFVVLTFFPAVSPAFSTNKSASIVHLDNAHDSALWHVLMNKPVEEDELISLYCPGGFTDEFDKRRQLKKASIEFKNCESSVKNASFFVLKTVYQVGAYDFNSKSYSVSLTEAESETAVDGAGYDILWKIPEEIRTLKINEKLAEKYQPRLNEVGNRIYLELYLYKPTASESTTANDSTGFRNLFFKTNKIIATIPRGRIDPWFTNALNPKEKEIELKTWVHGKNDKKYDGPNIEGFWTGTTEYPEREAGGVVIGQAHSCKLSLNFKQLRAILSGTCRNDVPVMGVINNPLAGEPSPVTRDGSLDGVLTKDGNFAVTITTPKDYGSDTQVFTGHFDGNVISGTVDGEDNHFKLIRGNANRNPSDSNENNNTTQSTPVSDSQVKPSDTIPTDQP